MFSIVTSNLAATIMIIPVEISWSRSRNDTRQSLVNEAKSRAESVAVSASPSTKPIFEKGSYLIKAIYSSFGRRTFRFLLLVFSPLSFSFYLSLSLFHRRICNIHGRLAASQFSR